MQQKLFHVAYCRAKEIKHSGPNIGKKVVKKTTTTVVNNSTRKSSSPGPPARPRGRPPKNGYPQKPPTDVVDSATKRKSGALNSDSTAADSLQLR